METRGEAVTSYSSSGLKSILGKVLRHTAACLNAKLQRADHTKRLILIERMTLGGRRQLALVECDGRLILLGLGSDGVQSIFELRETIGQRNLAGEAESIQSLKDAGQPTRDSRSVEYR